MNEHLQFEQDLELYALGALEGDEKRHLESHLRACAECARKLELARGRVALLALNAPSVTPRPQVRERLLRQIRAKPLSGRPRALSAAWRWATPAFAGLALVLAIAVGMLNEQNRDLRRRLSDLETARAQQEAQTARARAVLDVLTAPETIRVTLVAGATRPVPQGKAFYHLRKGLLFYAANLPALPAGETYQLWLVPVQGNPISAGIFKTDAQGNGEIVLPSLPAGVMAKAFAVTVEPSGGVPQPTGPKVLIGAVS